MTRLAHFDLKWFIALSLMFAALAFPIMTQVWFDYLNNGSSWRQGDWLINSADGFLRRSLIGDWLIWISETIGMRLLVVVLLVQSTLFVLLVSVLWTIGVLHDNKRLIMLLAASPAFFLIHWAGDVQGIMRKELFGFLSFAVLMVAGARAAPSVVLPIIAVVFFTLGCIGNVLHVFIGPLLLASLYILHQAGRLSSSLWRVLNVTIVVMSGIWFGVALWFKNASDLAVLCEPLLSNGFDDSICDGALRWMLPEVDHRAELALMATPIALSRFTLVTVLSLIPVVLAVRVFKERQQVALLALLAFAPFLPLYVVATDWGRWISICYTCFVMVLMLGQIVGRFHVVWLPPRWVAFVLLAVALVFSAAHGIGWQAGGPVRAFVTQLSGFF